MQSNDPRINENALVILRNELDRSAVISVEFKQYIMAYCSKACEQAYYRGVEEERKKHVDAGFEVK